MGELVRLTRFNSHISGALSDFGSDLLDANFLTVEDKASEAMLLVAVESEEGSSGSSDTCRVGVPFPGQRLLSDI